MFNHDFRLCFGTSKTFIHWVRFLNKTIYNLHFFQRPHITTSWWPTVHPWTAERSELPKDQYIINCYGVKWLCWVHWCRQNRSETHCSCVVLPSACWKFLMQNKCCNCTVFCSVCPPGTKMCTLWGAKRVYFKFHSSFTEINAFYSIGSSGVNCMSLAVHYLEAPFLSSSLEVVQLLNWALREEHTVLDFHRLWSLCCPSL